MTLSGFTGSLLPSGYLAGPLIDDARELGCVGVPPRVAREIEAVWGRAEAACGPTSGLRALFDLVADPLLTALGFRIAAVRFGPREARLQIRTPSDRPLVAVVLPWTSRPSSAWSELARDAGSAGADWGLVIAPPFLSVVRVRGTAVRHSLDVALPIVARASSMQVFWTLMRASAFDTTPPALSSFLDAIVGRAARFQHAVREDLQRGVADALDVLMSARSPKDQALTVVYRILFLLFAESRGLVPRGNPIYDGAYSMTTLCRAAIDGDSTGCWDALGAMTRLARRGCRSAGLVAAPFNGRLFARAAAPELERRRVSRRRQQRGPHDAALGQALVSLASRRSRAGREVISYRDLGVEQLGAVYERLLDAGDDASSVTRAGARSRTHSTLRKQSGTFYTPQSLAEFIVRRTLAPLVEGATSEAILALRVIDPAMGSGACLVAACRYLAAGYERALVDEGASLGDFDEPERANIRRLVAERCLMGVDRNATAVELARLSIWLTTLAHGKPLGFLDHRLRVGNSLVGGWPEDLGRLVTTPRHSNDRELPLFDRDDLARVISGVRRPLRDLCLRRDDSLQDVHIRADAWRQVSSASSPLEPWRQAVALWCARWFWPASAGPCPGPAETRALLQALLTGDRTLPASHVESRRKVWSRVAAEHGFFPWALEFPEVFHDEHGGPAERPGFDAVIGNPPWEMLRRDAGTQGESPRAMLKYVRESGQYPSCDRGHLNLYQAFLDRALAITRKGGRLGLVLPWSLASDDGAARLRARLLDEAGLDTIVGLDNARGLFPIHRGLRFVVVSGTQGRPASEIRARFGVTTAAELDELPGRDDPARTAYPVRTTTQVLRIAGGALRRIPDTRRPDDLTWLVGLRQRLPALGTREGWGVAFRRELNGTEARPLFGPTGLPVIEGKHIRPFRTSATATMRIERTAALRHVPDGAFGRARLAYRDVSGVANKQSLIAAIVPPDVVTTHTLLCLATPLPSDQQHYLCAIFNSYVLNAVARLLMGSHLTTTLVEDLPVPCWTGSPRNLAIAAAAVELSESKEDPGLSAWIQAAVAAEYSLDAGRFASVLGSFPLVAAPVRQAAIRAFEHVDVVRTGP